ncbi:hypothetical protein MJO28_010079 [Puccinia striiformis f. sp. tritici]|uniref:Uncharacterized protein n=1 Tax=Puccinia striiformis f. sp. tritici TaxID=168172 RepID=A0ACC0E9F5_9BASI|nr:hypothetical protein MJO28_010079 [Puccinia striiformis f. sp. tritici]
MFSSIAIEDFSAGHPIIENVLSLEHADYSPDQLRREPQVETQDLTIMNTTSELLENSFPQPQRKVIALFHAFILPEEEEPNSIKIDRNRNSVIILAENIGHTTHPLSDSSEMKIEDG